MTALTRPQSQKMIAGVCAGLANRYNWPVSRMRLFFLVSCVLPGPQFVLYLVLWAMMPKRG
ncbi:PspC domain-containing protein [Actinokineospora sp. 24-640]